MSVVSPGKTRSLLAAAVAAALLATVLGLVGTPNALDRRVEALPFEELGPAALEGVAALSRLGAPLGSMVLTALACAVLLVLRRGAAAGLLFVATSTAAVLFPLLKRGFALPRPGAPLVDATGYGLPSGHTLVSTVMWGCLAWILATHLRPTTGRSAAVSLCLVLPLAIGLTRIVLEVHWLTDVLAGWLYGLALLGLALWVELRGRRRRQA